MKTSIRTIALALIASLTLFAASTVEAAPPVATLIAPPQQQPNFLPKFGFRSYTLGGVGEVVTHVQWGGLAWKMGLQKGDIIRSVNHFQLTYHGAWNDALRSALYNGDGQVHLHIIDRNTGQIAKRNVNFGGYGTPYVVGYGGQESSYLLNNGGGQCYDEQIGYPAGPVTYKSQAGPQQKNKKYNSGGQISLQQIAQMFKDKD
jgi:hypothetical protein